MDETDHLNGLREIVAVMRELGVTHYNLPDGTGVVLGDAPRPVDERRTEPAPPLTEREFRAAAYRKMMGGKLPTFDTYK